MLRIGSAFLAFGVGVTLGAVVLDKLDQRERLEVLERQTLEVRGRLDVLAVSLAADRDQVDQDGPRPIPAGPQSTKAVDAVPVPAEPIDPAK